MKALGRILLLLLALFWSLEASCAQGWRKEEAVIAKIDDQVIALSDLRAELLILAWGDGALMPNPPDVATQMVRRKLLISQAEKLKMEAAQGEVAAQVDKLAQKGPGADAFWEKMKALGLDRRDVERRFREVALTNSFIALKKRSTYISENDVRTYFREQKALYSDKSLGDVRDEIREQLASAKYQTELADWIQSQINIGRVRILALPDDLAQY